MSRQVKRWVATCSVFEKPFQEKSAVECHWNDRTNPKLHATSAAATRESLDHVSDMHEVVGARQVTVERRYKLESEEIVS